MHVIAFNGSPRPHGNTSRMIRQLFKPLEEAGISTEEVLIGGNKVQRVSQLLQVLGTRHAPMYFRR